MIGVRLFDLRKDHDETQQDLAHAVGVSKHSISDYERDASEPPDKVKVQIAKHYNVSLDYLLGTTDSCRPIEDGAKFLRLPKGFPAEARLDLDDYVRYLMFKHNEKVK